MNVILICAFCAFVVIGAVIGLFKRYSRTSFWGGTVLFTLFAVRIAGDKVGKESGAYVATVLAIAVSVLVILTIFFESVRLSMKKGEEKRKKLSYYRHYDEEEENKELILDAVDKGDKKAYAKLSKKKFRQSGGAFGVLNVVFGGVSGAINAAMSAGVIICLLLVGMDIALSSSGSLPETITSTLTSGAWADFGAKWAVDLILIVLLCASIRIGFGAGISLALCTLCIIGLVGAAGYGAYAFAFGSGTDNIVNRLIVAAIVFLVLLIFVFIAAVMLPKLVARFRDNRAFAAVDGVFGAIVFCAFIFALIAVALGITYQFSTLDSMSRINFYLTSSHISDSLYTYSPIQSLFSFLKSLMGL